jgi:hypothetical protein
MVPASVPPPVRPIPPPLPTTPGPEDRGPAPATIAAVATVAIVLLIAFLVIFNSLPGGRASATSDAPEGPTVTHAPGPSDHGDRTPGTTTPSDDDHGPGNHDEEPGETHDQGSLGWFFDHGGNRLGNLATLLLGQPEGQISEESCAQAKQTLAEAGGSGRLSERTTGIEDPKVQEDVRRLIDALQRYLDKNCTVSPNLGEGFGPEMRAWLEEHGIHVDPTGRGGGGSSDGMDRDGH